MDEKPTCRMDFDEKSQVIYQWIEGSLDEDDSNRMTAGIVELKKRLREPDKIRILAISEKPEKPTPGARRLFMENARKEDLYKMAVLGRNPYMRAAVSFLLMVSGLKKIRIFPDETAALKWLNS
jgi:hypothetical protein